jgi:hypothetical protein
MWSDSARLHIKRATRRLEIQKLQPTYGLLTRAVVQLPAGDQLEYKANGKQGIHVSNLLRGSALTRDVPLATSDINMNIEWIY